jgi:hypothetical protein
MRANNDLEITPRFVYLNQRGRAGFVFGEVRDSSLAPFPTRTFEQRDFTFTQAL